MKPKGFNNPEDAQTLSSCISRPVSERVPSGPDWLASAVLRALVDAGRPLSGNRLARALGRRRQAVSAALLGLEAVGRTRRTGGGWTAQPAPRCRGQRADGSPCRRDAGLSGFCTYHEDQKVAGWLDYASPAELEQADRLLALLDVDPPDADGELFAFVMLHALERTVRGRHRLPVCPGIHRCDWCVLLKRWADALDPPAVLQIGEAIPEPASK